MTNIYICETCNKSFKSELALRGHSKVHKENYKKSDPSIYSKKRRETAIKEYKKNPKTCKHCDTTLSYDDAKTKTFCDSSCAASHNNIGITRNPKKPKPPKIKKQPKYTEEERKRLACERVMRYRARKYAQTSPDVDRKAIREIYKNCPDGYEVDHIIPLSRGGLHHQDNLQYLTRSDNARKGNKLPHEL